MALEQHDDIRRVMLNVVSFVLMLQVIPEYVALNQGSLLVDPLDGRLLEGDGARFHRHHSLC